MKKVPFKRGDIVAAPNFSLDQQGHEIQKSRPALVITPEEYNKKFSIILCCPITNTISNHPWCIPLPKNLSITGAILVNHLRAFDQYERRFQKIGEIPSILLKEVLSKLLPLVT